MEFRNKYDSTADFKTETGSMFSPIYKLAKDKDGTIDLIQDGEENIYEQIQSHADSVDINVIMARYENGDTSVLQRRTGQYIDVSDMPNNFTEMLQSVIIAEKNFEELPIEIRSQYGSVAEYVNDIGSEKWLSLFKSLEPALEPVVEPKKEEVASE